MSTNTPSLAEWVAAAEAITDEPAEESGSGPLVQAQWPMRCVTLNVHAGGAWLHRHGACTQRRTVEVATPAELRAALDALAGAK